MSMISLNETCFNKIYKTVSKLLTGTVCIKKNRDSLNVEILVPEINIKVTPRLLDIYLPYSKVILSHF